MRTTKPRRTPRRFKRKPNPWTKFTKDEPAPDYICNLSSHTLTKPQRQVLNRGLNFVVTNNTIPDYSPSFCRFSRSLRLREHFQDAPSLEPGRIPPYKKASTWMPPRAPLHIEDYLNRVKADLANPQTRPIVKENLPKAQKIAVRELCKLDLIIRQADKGSCIVVEDKSQYIKDGLAHLSDTTIYTEIATDPTIPLTAAINQYAKHLGSKGHLTTDMVDYLTTELSQVRTQTMYFLKKLHKGPHVVRPIVSGSGGPTERVSALLDFFAAPKVKHTKAFLRDSKDLIGILEQLFYPL